MSYRAGNQCKPKLRDRSVVTESSAENVGIYLFYSRQVEMEARLGELITSLTLPCHNI